MRMHSRRPMVVALIAGIMTCGAVGVAPVHAQSGITAPIVILPITPGQVTIPVIIPPISVGGSENSRGGVTWSTSGRADVDIDVERQHGRDVVR